MNFVITSPFYPQNFQNFAIRMKANGINVLGIGQEPYDQLGYPLQEALKEYFRVDNMEDIDQVKRALAFLFYKHGPIDGLESQNEYWLELDSSLREQFNIPGLRPAELKKFKHKSLQKEFFKKAGVPVIDGFLIKNEDDFKKTIKKIGLPLVAKPDSGVGSAATYKIESKEDIEKFLNEWDRNIEYFIESYIQGGVLCTYDGLIDLDGNIIFQTGLYHTIPTLELVNDQLDLAFVVAPKLDPKLVEYGRAAVKEFAMKGRFFHIEFFKKNDDYIAIEYNNRITGGYAIDVYNHAFGIDLYDIFARMIKGEKIDKIPASDKFAIGLSQRNIYTYQNYEGEIRAKYGKKVMQTGPVPQAFKSIQGDYMYIITTKEADEVDEIINFVHRHK